MKDRRGRNEIVIGVAVSVCGEALGGIFYNIVKIISSFLIFPITVLYPACRTSRDENGQREDKSISGETSREAGQSTLPNEGQ